MTNTESRIAVELDELAAWDDADALARAHEHITEHEVRELAVYAFDSDKQTLVGLGPVERARRSRSSAEIPESERMPHSEPPGPFIADDDEDLTRLLRRRELGPWWAAVPAVLAVAAAAVALSYGGARAPAGDRPALAAAAARTTEGPAAKADVPPTSAPVPAAAPVPAVEPAPEPQDAQRAVVESAPRSSSATPPPLPSALPVKLPELTSPTVVDLSPGADATVGTLDVTSNPPANVVLDGRPIGKAPRVVRVLPGVHTVLFIHPLYGRRSLSVNVSEGRAARASADF